MTQKKQNLYFSIASLITQQVMQSTLSERLESEDFSLEKFDQCLAKWVAGLNTDQLQLYLSQHAIQQKLSVTANKQEMLSAQSPLNFIDLNVISNTTFRLQAKKICMQYGVVHSPFGFALLGFTEAGICHLSFHYAYERLDVFLRSKWLIGKIEENQMEADCYAEQIFQRPNSSKKIRAWTYGTAFQRKVWQTLMQLGSGELISYQQLAHQAGAPRAARAVGSAMANNRLPWLIPCHRVLRQSGDFGRYGGGTERKIAMIAYEAAHARA